ncbi:DUF2938 family protein [Ralstonia pseudosolanacearum]
MSQTIVFILVIGIGSTIALDAWGIITTRIGWMQRTHWPSVGRWLLGIPAGRLVFDREDTSPNTAVESIAGWTFHYAVGIAYAMLFPLIWGTGFIATPTIVPFLLIGVVVSTLAGLVILMPAMGAGLFARKTPTPVAMIIYVLVAHVIFAAAQYFLALASA